MTILILFFSFLLFIGRSIASVECLADQNSPLLQLKEGFSFPSRGLVSWKPGSNCCNWEGVTCDSESGRVIGLDLSMRNITGTIGDSLFNLTYLQTLNLAYNQFESVPIPSGFERLLRLLQLNLSSAGFIGQIPNGISNLIELVSLDLSISCDDVTPAHSLRLENPDLQALIRKLSNLKELYLDCVSLSHGTEWYKTLSPMLPQLRVLSLKNCNLSGVLLKGIFQHRNLNILDLSNNKLLSGSLPDFPKESTLQRLLLSSTNLSGSLTETIGNLKSLIELDLSNCHFSGLVPPSIGSLPRLLHLNLSSNGFTGAIPSFQLGAPIVELHLAGNSFSRQVPSSYGRHTNLTILNLSNNSLSGPIPLSLFSLPSLQALYLDHNQLTNQLGEFQNASSLLRTIDLSDNQIHGQIPRSLFKLSGLQFLGLASNNFNGTLELGSFYSFNNLTFLDLSSNKLSVRDNDGDSSTISFPKIITLKLVSCNLSSIPTLLKYQDRMKTLDLSNNRIAGGIPKWIWSIGNQTLTILNLSYNFFTYVEGSMLDFSHNSKFSPIILDLSSNMLRGPILLPPRETVILDFSNNYFYSIIPFNISCYLNSTIFFSLANNTLTGEIPPTICNASSLQILDLSDNLLSGPIPQCILKHRKNLTVLNLRGNKLNGKIPHLISNRCGMRTINLNGNYLEGGVPPSLVNCNDLEVIDLGNNCLVDPFPYWLGRISSIRILVLRSNGFYGPVGLPPFISYNNYKFTFVQIMDISFNNFSGSLPAHCFSHLKAMTLESQPNSSVVGEFVHPQLKQISEGFFYHDTIVVTSKGQDTKLVKILTIYNYIDISNNNFEGSIPDTLGHLQSLYVLNMSHNAFTGQIPATFGNMTQLESLDLSSNHLSGKIPPELTFLTFLSFINLSNNNLVGRIPQGNQLSTFANTSYQGNTGLCGSPLSKQCGEASPSSNISDTAPTESDDASSDKTYEIWLALSIGLGYGFGIAMVFALQNVSVREWKKVRQWLLVLRNKDDSMSDAGHITTVVPAVSTIDQFDALDTHGTSRSLTDTIEWEG